MIKGILTKFQPLKTGEVSVMVTTTKEYLHELVDLQDKEIFIQALQVPLQAGKTQILTDILRQMEGIKAILVRENMDNIENDLAKYLDDDNKQEVEP